MILKGFLRKITQKFFFKANILYNSKKCSNFANSFVQETQYAKRFGLIDNLK